MRASKIYENGKLTHLIKLGTLLMLSGDASIGPTLPITFKTASPWTIGTGFKAEPITYSQDLMQQDF